ncbi:hypothetical protein [Thiomonas intermedia]|uniref:hypothetical protein n=1 Tax=Thiomonas intermedia TaxID=926 RepID=UPI0009A5136D|nr:hypothetical protein [Thiomonas intermedia]
MKWGDVTSQLWSLVCHFIGWLDSLEAKDYATFIPMIIALLAVFFGPLMMFWLGRRQIKMQEAIAKRQIADSISAKRQAWINELRAEMAEYLTVTARCNDLRRPAPNLTPEQAEKNFAEFATCNSRAHELGVRIKLRMNPEEDDHNKLDGLLKALADASPDPPAGETEEQAKASIARFNEARGEVIAFMQKLLKKEWERVKKGDM